MSAKIKLMCGCSITRNYDTNKLESISFCEKHDIAKPHPITQMHLDTEGVIIHFRMHNSQPFFVSHLQNKNTGASWRSGGWSGITALHNLKAYGPNEMIDKDLEVVDRAMKAYRFEMVPGVTYIFCAGIWNAWPDNTSPHIPKDLKFVSEEAAKGLIAVSGEVLWHIAEHEKCLFGQTVTMLCGKNVGCAGLALIHEINPDYVCKTCKSKYDMILEELAK